MRDKLHAYHQRTAGPVVDDDLLIHLAHEFRRDEPRDGVRGAAGRLRHDQANRAHGKIGRSCRAREHDADSRGNNQML